MYVGLKAQIIYWDLGLDRKREKSEDKRMVVNGSNSGFNEQGTNEKVV